MKRALLLIACVLVASMTMLAQDVSQEDYIPFVELGKQWHVVNNATNPYVPCSFERVEMYEKVERDGKTYVHTASIKDGQGADGYREIGLFREENGRVYKYEGGRDVMLYDFSLKEGDTFTYESEPTVKCKVLKQGWLDDGPDIMTSENKYRKLRTWTIGVENASGGYYEITWIEGIGTLRNMFYRPDFVGVMSCLAYVERDNSENAYLPFSLYNMYGPVHGCNLPTSAADNMEFEDWHHRLTYELEGDRLHVYGKVFCSCGVDHYAYFSEEQTDDPMVRKLHFEIQNANTANALACQAYHPTNFYVPGFDPNLNYIVVDNQGEEHPVINKTPQNAYRPFIEEDKVWIVGCDSPSNPVQLFVEYYYFDGDTIISGKPCKQMMCQRYVSPDHPDYAFISRYPMLRYVGAWYEEDKKVYLCNTTNQQFRLMYDFSANANDTLQIDDAYIPYVLGPKQTGGIKGFKGVYRDVMTSVEGHNHYNTTWLEGVGGIDGPIVSIYYGKENHVGFLMSCTVGDEVIYLNDGSEVEMVEATPYGSGARKRFDFTHTIKTKPKARIKRGTSDACISSSERGATRPEVKARKRSEENQSLYGEYNDLQLGINLNPLNDAYLVSITNESGKVVYEKSINAGNIVGLNIDISAYAKGHYTITMENSQEIFTGEFEAQATGIEEIRNKKSEGRSIIYNLQGQRLSTLQRGLNIINGQKVFVR